MIANESGFWVHDNRITAIMRNHNSVQPELAHAAVAYSDDYGESWSMTRESNLPLTVSKPYCGTLSSGYRYVIGNSIVEPNSGRKYLTIAISDPNVDQLCSIHLIRDLTVHPSPEGDAIVKSICYPHAMEYNNCLYVIHSAGSNHNQNNIDLAIIPLNQLIGND